SAQTDLPLLVLVESGRFLRGNDVKAGDREDRFFHWDSEDGLRAAPRDTLDLGGRSPELEGTWTVTLHDGTTAEVTTVFALLRERLADYSPERSAEICGASPETIRDLARMVARRRTKILEGFNAPKYY